MKISLNIFPEAGSGNEIAGSGDCIVVYKTHVRSTKVFLPSTLARIFEFLYVAFKLLHKINFLKDDHVFLLELLFA